MVTLKARAGPKRFFVLSIEISALAAAAPAAAALGRPAGVTVATSVSAP